MVMYTLVAIVTDLCCYLTYDSRGAWHTLISGSISISLMIQEEHGIQSMPCSSRIRSEMLPEIHTVEKCDFLRSLIHSQIISFFFLSVLPLVLNCSFIDYLNYR